MISLSSTSIIPYHAYLTLIRSIQWSQDILPYKGYSEKEVMYVLAKTKLDFVSCAAAASHTRTHHSHRVRTKAPHGAPESNPFAVVCNFFTKHIFL